MAAVTLPRMGQTLLTAEVFFEQYGDRRFELVDGVPVELPMPGTRHGKVSLRIGNLLLTFVDLHDLGHVMSNDSFVVVRRNPDTVLGPDVYFVSYARLPKGPVPDGPLTVPPELVFEVRSPSDRVADLLDKAAEYLAAGVTYAVVVDPESETATACRRDAEPVVARNHEALTFPDILPGFELSIASVLG